MNGPYNDFKNSTSLDFSINLILIKFAFSVNLLDIQQLKLLYLNSSFTPFCSRLKDSTSSDKSFSFFSNTFTWSKNLKKLITKSSEKMYLFIYLCIHLFIYLFVYYFAALLFVEIYLQQLTEAQHF